MRLRVLASSLLLTVTAFAAGESAVVSAGPERMSGAMLAGRLARVPSFQLARYGETPEAQRKAFVEEVIVPELLFAAAAKERKLDERPGVRERIRDILKDAFERSLKTDPALKAQVTDEAVKAYFEENRARFETPKRVRVWRILVADEAVAREIIAAAKGADGPKRWSQLARDKSLDKATALRNGDLGFVRPDGSTDAPRVKVDAAIVAAADKLKDGEVSSAPVSEGDKFAVVWRRGSMPEVKRALKDEAQSIRQLLERRAAEQARKDLLAKLRKEQVKDVHPELLEHIDTAAFGPPPKRRSERESAKKRRPQQKGPKPAGSQR